MKEQDCDTRSMNRRGSVTKILNERPKWRHLFAFTAKHHLYYLSGAVASSAGTAALRTTLAFILGRVFDLVVAAGDGQIARSEVLSRVSRYCVILVALGAAQWIINSAFLALWVIFGELQANNIRQTLFSGLIKMKNAWIGSLPHGTTGLVASIQRNTHEIQIATSQVFGYLIADILTAIGSLAVALYTSWKLTLVLLATVPLSFAVLALTGRKIQPAITKQTSNLDSASTVLAGSLGGIDLVKLCNGCSCEIQNYMAHINHAARQYRIQARYHSFQIGYTNFWAVSMFVIGFWYGLTLVQNGEHPGNVLTTLYAVLATLQGVESLLPNWLVFQKGMSAGQVLKALHVEVADVADDDTGTAQPGYFVGAIDLHNISFSYPTAPSFKSLNRCTLSIPAGEFTFLVGRSGSGKSTIASLVSRTYDAADDGIYIDGIPIKKLQKQWIEKHIMLLEQTPVIFNDTLFRNIVFGLRDAASVANHRVLQACQRFGLASTIATLAGGLHAVVGGKGCPLSGGQRQRIALARAYLRDPTVLILDEPTSALDRRSTEMIMREIRKWRRGKTTVIISHDLDRIRDDEFVYVLDKGTVTESGFKRNLRNDGLAVFLTEALNEAIRQSAAYAEINVMPSVAEDVQDFTGRHRHRQPPAQPQTWLMSSTNSSSRNSVSLLSPRLSILSSPTRPVRMNTIFSPTPALRSGALSPSLTVVQQQSLDNARVSSVFNSSIRSTPWKASMDITGRDLQLSPLKRGLDLDTISNTSEDSGFIKNRKKRRVVELGISTKRHKKTSMSFWSILRTVALALDAPNRACLVVGVVTTMIAALTTPAFSFCLAKLLAAMWSAADKGTEGKQWAFSLIIIAVVDGVCAGIGRYLLETSAQAWIDSARHTALKRILHQPKSWFIDNKNSQTRIMEAFNVHAEEMRNLVGRFVPAIVSVVTMISVSLVWALIICWDLSLVALAPLPLVILALKAYTFLGKGWETRCSNAIEQTGQVLGEVLAFSRTIANYSLESHFARKFGQAVSQCLGLGFQRAFCIAPLFGLYQAFSYGLTSLMFYYGTLLLTRSEPVSADRVLQVLNLLLFSIGTATELLSAMPQITITTASAARVLAYTELSGEAELPPDVEPQVGRANLLPIRIRNLTFAYPGPDSRKTVNNATVNILPGRCTVLVGASGCGKSTLLALILGLYRPAREFALTYADTPCSMMNPQQLRATVGYVPQTPFLFPGTIADNIAYGLDPASALRHLANIRAAAQDAGIDDFILSLPEGYNTRVGDGSGATSLSGGQAQRVTIARALVRRPSLLVMDEPTSALDQESAMVIRGCIAELVARWRAERRSAAVVVATHNVEMMRVADTIVVMDKGHIAEQGAFEDLWFNGDAFRRLMRQNDTDS